MVSVCKVDPWKSYDNWKCEDTVGEALWEEEYKFLWVLSLVKQENPHLDDEAAQHIAEERYYSGYYNDLDF